MKGRRYQSYCEFWETGYFMLTTCPQTWIQRRRCTEPLKLSCMNHIKGEQLIDLEQPLVKVRLLCSEHSIWNDWALWRGTCTQCCVQVPYEQLRKSVKYSNKHLEVQIGNILDAINRCSSAAARNEVTPAQAAETMDQLLEQLESTKRKVREHPECLEVNWPLSIDLIPAAPKILEWGSISYQKVNSAYITFEWGIARYVSESSRISALE